VIAGAGFKAGLKERLNLIYSRNLISWCISMSRETITNKVWSTSFREIVSRAHKIIIHLYTRFERYEGLETSSDFLENHLNVFLENKVWRFGMVLRNTPRIWDFLLKLLNGYS
jgi:hypothetical protein